MRKLIYYILKTYWFIFRPKTFGVKCLVLSNNEILMIKNRDIYKSWMFPGGGVKRNEDSANTAKREVFEETGIRVDDIKKIGEFTSNKEYKRDTVFVFTGKAKNKDIKIDPIEVSEAQWFNLNNLPEVSPYSKKMLKMFLEN